MLEIAFLVNKPGEMDLDTTVADSYVGGAPLAVTANGKVALCKDTTAAKFVGLARNDKSVDLANGKATYISEIGEVVLKPSLDTDGVTKIYPYLEAFSAYVPGDRLYIVTATGKWTRVSTGVTGLGILLVMKKTDGEGLYCQIKSAVTYGA